ncbi:MAG: FMN-binding negative transcriptional regulator [Dehalococcoidia bacterium]
MYVPKHFAIDDPSLIASWIDEIGFGVLVTAVAGQPPEATHIPLLFEAGRGPLGTLRGHIARANPQREAILAGASALAIFQGPHGYVSPRWYGPEPAVPTWNYVAIHATGRLRPLDPSQSLAAVDALVARYEDGAWTADVEYAQKLLNGIIAFDLEIERLEGKAKLSQNRPADVASVIAGLRATGRQDDASLADAMTGPSQGTRYDQDEPLGRR